MIIKAPATKSSIDGKALVWLVPLLLLTMWLGARGLNADIIWRDEYHTLEDAGSDYLGPFSPLGVWQQVAQRNPWHAPGYFILVNLWQRGVGADPAAIRALSLLLGVLTVALTYRLGRQTVGWRVGVYAAILVGTSAFFVHFLHEMRVYTLMAFLSVVTASLYWQIIGARREPPLWMWLLFVAAAAGLFYSHYFAAIPLAILGLYHLVFVPKTRRWWWMLVAMVVSGLLFVPWLTVLLQAMKLVAARENLNSPALSFEEVLAVLVFQFSNGVIPLALLVGVAALVYRRGAWRFVTMLAVGSVLLLLVTNAIVEVMHEGRQRYLLGVWPLLAVAFALGIAALQRYRPTGLVILVVWAAFGIGHSLNKDLVADLDGANYVFPFHWVAQAAEVLAKPGDVFVNYVPDDGLRVDLYETIANYYFSRKGMEYLLVWTPEPYLQAERQTEVFDLLASRERFWLATMPEREPKGLEDFKLALESLFILCERVRDDDLLNLVLFARALESCPNS
jgi:hypothetical protein